MVVCSSGVLLFVIRQNESKCCDTITLIVYHFFYFVKVTLSYAIILMISSILELVVVVDSRSSGAPIEACAQIAPQHGSNSPSTDPLPFSVDLSDFTFDCYIGGQSYNSKHSWVVYILYTSVPFLQSHWKVGQLTWTIEDF